MAHTRLGTAVDQVMLDRPSIRAFLPAPLAREEIEYILRIASNAPSGSNIQPWRVHALTSTRQPHRSGGRYALLACASASATASRW